MTDGSNTTDRSKLGSKRHISTDNEGISLSTSITSANNSDVTVETNIDNTVIKRPLPSKFNHKQNLCIERTYHSKKIDQEIFKRGYIPSISHRRKEEIMLLQKKHTARRWVVESTNSWHNRFRKLFTNYEEKDDNYFGQ